MERKVVIYTRVSTREQDTSNQMPEMQQWIADRGYKLVAVYSEQESGFKDGHQKELAQLIRDLPKRKVDIVLVWSLDRLTREGSGALIQLIHKFNVYGVDVLSCQEPWLEQEGIARDLLIVVFGWVAQYESRRLSRRVLAGLDRAKAKGQTLGRPPGSKDKKRRKRTGYLLRYASKKRAGDFVDGGADDGGHAGNEQTNHG